MQLLTIYDQIFAASRKASQKMDMVMQPIATEMDLTVLQLKMIIALGAGTAKDMAMGELGKSVGITGGNISNTCKRIEKLGYVKRKRSAKDERIVNVSLTKAGQEVCDKVIHYLRDTGKEQCIATDTKAFDMILEGLEVLNDRLDAHLTNLQTIYGDDTYNLKIEE